MDWLSRNPELDLDALDSCEDPDEVDDHDDDAGKYNHEYQKGLLNGSIKEPSRNRLRSLQAILKTLLESPFMKWAIRIKDVRKTSFKDLDITDHECTVIAKIANTLRPYVPKRRILPDGTIVEHLPHIALRASLVLIANRTLQIAGYSHFTRQITPLISTGSIHALALGAVGVYNVFYGQAKGRFDVQDAHGNPLTSAANITRFPANKEAVFGAFFDMRRVKAVCKDHGIVFTNRITYVDQYTMRLTGKVIPSENRQAVMSPYEARRKTNHGTPSGLKWDNEFAASV
ncbi:MAG: hypothetical protein J3Q66DRAFT_423656 [Benniella sp.]|nr:MAG: hypothetical protein J3Q66DRAFT_423656 [Benniella sp.]